MTTENRQQGWVIWFFSLLLLGISAGFVWYYLSTSEQMQDNEQTLSQLQRQQQNDSRQLERVQNELTQLQQQLRSANSELSDSQSQLAASQQELEQSNALLRDQQQTVERLQNQNAQLLSQLNEQQSNLAELQEELQQELSEAEMTEQAYLAAREQLALEQSENETYSETIARLQTQLAEEAAAMQRLEDELNNQLQALNNEKESLITRLENGTTAIKLPESILFPTASADISEQGQKTLAALAKALASFPNHLISIQGHTDSRAISPNTSLRYASNWELSSARASSAVRVLIKQGIAPQQLQAVGFADTQPLRTEKTPQAYQANRRIEVVLLPNQFKTRVLAP